MKQLMSDDVYVDLMKGVRASDAERARGGTDAVLGTGRAMLAMSNLNDNSRKKSRNAAEDWQMKKIKMDKMRQTKFCGHDSRPSHQRSYISGHAVSLPIHTAAV
jgi:hypothetical protein